MHYTNAVADVFHLYNYFVQGVMPFSGGVQEQPASLLRAFNLISVYMAEAQEQT